MRSQAQLHIPPSKTFPKLPSSSGGNREGFKATRACGTGEGPGSSWGSTAPRTHSACFTSAAVSPSLAKEEAKKGPLGSQEGHRGASKICSILKYILASFKCLPECWSTEDFWCKVLCVHHCYRKWDGIENWFHGHFEPQRFILSHLWGSKWPWNQLLSKVPSVFCLSSQNTRAPQRTQVTSDWVFRTRWNIILLNGSAQQTSIKRYNVAENCDGWNILGSQHI